LQIKPNISKNELMELPLRRGSAFSLAQMFHIALDFFPKFLNLKWRFLFTTQGYKYVVSDNPVYFYSPAARGMLPRDDFLREDIEITLPLSKEVALFAGRHNIQDGYGNAHSQTIKSITARTVLSANRRVYASMRSDGLHRLVQRYKDDRPYMVMHKGE
jgi:hypothetical protein